MENKKKPKKLSKSNQDPKQIEKDRAQLKKILSKKSPHFEEGAKVFVNGNPATILVNSMGVLTVAFDDENRTVKCLGFI